MVNLLHQDTFTGTNGTALGDGTGGTHVPDIDTVGGGYTVQFGNGLEIQSNKMEVTGEGATLVYIDSGESDIHLQHTFQSDNIEAAPIDLILRYQDSNHYWRLYVRVAAYRLLEVNGSTFTRDTVVKTTANDVPHTINFKADGDTISYWVDEDAPSEYVSTLFQTETVVGWRGFGTATDTSWIDDFNVVTLGAGGFISAATKSASAASDGVATVDGIAAALFPTEGSSDGVATVAGEGCWIVVTNAGAVGESAIDGISAQIAGAVGLSEATSATDGISAEYIIAGTGSSVGESVTTGAVSAFALTNANAAGDSATLGDGVSVGGAIGTSAGTSVTMGISGTTSGSTASTDGTSIALADGEDVGFSPIFVLSASDNIAPSGENTTPQLTPPSGKTTGDFGGGRIQDDENPTDTVDIGDGEYREDEWAIEATTDAVLDDVYEFRVLIDGIPAQTISETPEWTISTVGGAEETVGTIVGTSSAQAIAAGTAQADTSSDGTSTAQADSSTITLSEASAAGTSVVTGISSNVASTEFSATGESAVVGISGATSGSVAHAEGTSLVLFSSDEVFTTIGSIAGTSTVTGIASAIWEVDLSATGDSVVTGIASSITEAGCGYIS